MVDRVDSSSAGMGALPGVGSLGAIQRIGVNAGMGNLRALESPTGMAEEATSNVGMGDVLADRMPGGSVTPAPHAGMGDLRSRE